ncbi:hypothetical protein C8F01DRAFT_1109890 [Mycena amicta]|nr:hypothetical protein C8F01DRAFT_1109890 [Mycena amicta]
MTSPNTSPHPIPPTSAQPDNSFALAKRRARNITVEIESEFQGFDCENNVIFPFQDESARDSAFQKELNDMLLDCTIEMHAWASARPFHETDAATTKYEKQIMALQHQENQQEKTRQRLQEFVTRMRTALAALQK